MLNLPIFSQRDDRWKNDKHGTSSSTLGQTGCLVTALAMIFKYFGLKDTTPKLLNQILTKNKGYANGNLVIWQRVAELTGMKFVKRVNPYSNTDVAWNIYVRKIPVLVEVLAPKGVPGGKHWVVFLGNQKAIDPWTGTITSTSKYTAIGYAIYKPA
jgi:hypothetical protein